MTVLQLGKLQEWIQQGKLDPTKQITMKELLRSGVVHNVKEGGIKLLGNVCCRVELHRKAEVKFTCNLMLHTISFYSCSLLQRLQ